MSFDPNTPASANETFGVSQSKIRGNFQALNTAFSVNHVALNDGSQGKHKFLQMPEQGAAPTTAANEGGLYTKDVSGSTQLFYREQSSGLERQITSPFTAGVRGEFIIPGGLTVKWGQSSFSGSASSVNVLFTTGGGTNFSSAIYIVTFTLIGTAGGVSATSQATTGFTAHRTTTQNNQAFNWVAIGV